MVLTTTTNYSDLTGHLKKIDQIYNEAMADAVSDMVGLDIFEDKTTKTKNDTIKLNHGLAGVTKIAEGATFPEATGKEGDIITFTKSKYGADVVLTKEARVYDEYGEVLESVKTIVDDGMSKIDQSLADVLSNGFAATAYTDVYGDTITPIGPDGKALFHAAHTNGATARTYSNIITASTVNPALTADAAGVAALQAGLTQGLTFKDVNGIIRSQKFDTLLVPAELEYIARILTESDRIPGSANNDINPLKGKLKVKVWSRLGTTGAGVSKSGQWYLYDSKKIQRTLKLRWAQQPQLAEPKEFDANKNWHWMFDYLYSKGFAFQAYIFGSKGTAAA